jgi:thiosulfate/3-mercaptopyruvate sulfurtransferase
MNTHRLSILLSACLLAAGAFAADTTCGGHGNRDTMVVNTQWLSGHLKDPNLVILAIGQKDEFAKEHIPGALATNLDEIATPMVMGKLMLELPPMDQLAKTFTALGITNNSRIVLYLVKDGLATMTRVYLTLDAAGLGARTAILDGGFPAWKSEGLPVTAEVRAVRPGKLDICPQSDVIASAEWVRANAGHTGAAMVDARLERFYTGEAAGRNHDGSDQRKGHIPGARNLPFNTFTDQSGKFLSADEWKKKYAAAGIKSGDRVVSYCHIGQQATVIYFVSRYLGYDARLYDGSWEDWSAHADYPVETK